MTLYYLTSPKVTIGLIGDEIKIVDAPPFAEWAIGKETYHVLRWLRERGFQVQSKRVAD